MNVVVETLKKTGIIPVVAIEDAQDAVPLAEALIKGGIACAEITFRTGAATEAMKKITERFPQMLVGAGTVLNQEQVKAAVDSGAAFIVSPGFNPKVADYCIQCDIPIIPGVCCPSEVEAAMERGLKTVKFFPAEASGGIDYLKALWGPYRDMNFIPTGGINADNLNDYLRHEKIVACGGSWMVKPQMIKNHEFEKIESLTKEAVDRMLGLRITSIDFSVGKREGVGELDSPLRGIIRKSTVDIDMAGQQGGTVYIETNSLERTVYYIEKSGIKVQEKDSALKTVTLCGEVEGFVVKIVEK